MATANLMDYLAGDALTKLASAFANKPGVVRPLPAAFYAGTPNGNVGTTISFDIETASREAAKIRNPDSPSANVQGVASQNKKVVGLGSRESYTIGLDLIQALQQPGDIVRRNAQMELERQVKNFVGRFTTLRTNAVHSALLKGKINITAAGDIQVTESSPARQIDFGIPEVNQLSPTSSGNKYIIGDWSNAATDIVTAVSTLKQFAAKTYSMGIDTVFYGIDVPGYLAKNTAFKEYLTQNSQFNTNYVKTGEIPNGVLGLNWVPVGTATSVLSGTATSWCPVDFLAFMPALDAGWYEVVDCGLPAPMGVTSDAQLAQAMLDANSLTAAFPVRYGVHSYTVMNTDPPSAKLIVADFHCPILKSPNAYYLGNC